MKAQGLYGEEPEVECNFIDLGVPDVSEDMPTMIEDEDYFLPPVPREASGLSLVGQEVLALGGTIGSHTDFYKTKKIQSGKASTAWTQPQPRLQQDSCSSPVQKALGSTQEHHAHLHARLCHVPIPAIDLACLAYKAPERGECIV